MYAVIYRDSDDNKTWIQTSDESFALAQTRAITDSVLFVDYARYHRAKEECERLRNTLRKIKGVCEEDI